MTGRYADAELLGRAQSQAAGDRIRHLRHERDWSQKTLAGKSGISAAAISHAETGATRLRIVNAGKVAAAFGVTVEELTERTGQR